MNPLPHGYSSNSRPELAAFLSLSLAGAAMIGAAVSSALEFAAARDCILRAWSAPASAETALASNRMNRVVTNVTLIRTAAPGGSGGIRRTSASPRSLTDSEFRRQRESL